MKNNNEKNVEFPKDNNSNSNSNININDQNNNNNVPTKCVKTEHTCRYKHTSV